MLDFISQLDLPTVLLIDDDMVSREVMATMLTMSGYSVHTAADGAQGLTLLAGKECDPTVILMDVQMPGISGMQLIEQLRIHSQARLYVISASDTPKEILDASDGFILKPFPPEALTRLLEQAEAAAQPPAVAGLDPAETVINSETLAQLREMMPETAVRQIFEAIVADLGRRTAALEAAITQSNWIEARRLGHAIKGGGSMAGAVQVARIGGLIESGGLEPSAINQSDNSQVILTDLRAATVNLQRMLDDEIKP